MRLARALTAVALAALCGCMTVDTMRDPGYEGPWVYSGVRKDGTALDTQISTPEAIFFWFPFVIVDAPFSFLADTVLLPVTIPRDQALAKKAADEAEVASERPGPIAPIAGEEPVATARRLFERCAQLLKQQDAHATDCYSIDAEIDIAGGNTLRGAQYKDALRAALERDVRDGQYLEWRDPTYTADGANVRIDATRAATYEPLRSPVVLRVGPCPDGAWRIVSEASVGWAKR
ncbi:MAG TPA: YceK/YidQ family lipoprotein [Myxococcota bacterium]|nr:YceK/YidQ family lipoprotein [Myxococcota bacterium]